MRPPLDKHEDRSSFRMSCCLIKVGDLEEELAVGGWGGKKALTGDDGSGFG